MRNGARAGGCYYFDEIGVPSPEEMERVYGGGVQWQAAALEEWIRRLAAVARLAAHVDELAGLAPD